MSAQKKRTKPTHPPYALMIKEAIVTLKERGGSSRQALRKYIGTRYKLPEGWEKKLSFYLKKMTLEGALVQVKASWKLGEKLKKQPMTKPREKAAVKATKSEAKEKLMESAPVTKKGTKTAAAAGKKVKPQAAKSRAKPSTTKKVTPTAKKTAKKTTPAAPKKKGIKATKPIAGGKKSKTAAKK